MKASLHDQSKNSQGHGSATVAQAEHGPAEQSRADTRLEATFKNDLPPSTRHSRWIYTALESYLFVLVAILALEAFFSIAGIGQGEIVRPDLQLGCKHIDNKMVTWRLEGFSHDRLNSAGMRDVEHPLAKAPETKRVAFLGDSFTEGLQVPMQDTFAQRLQTRLNKQTAPSKSSGLIYETLNFGCSSYSTGQELVQFNQEVAPYKPDLVVLLYTPGDTSENSISPSKRAGAEARPYFYLDRNNVLRQDNGILALNFEKLRPRPIREFLRAHSTIFGAYNQINLSLTMSDRVYFRTTRLITQISTQISNKITALMPSSRGEGAQPKGLLPPTRLEPDRLAVSEAIIKKLDSDVRASGGKLVLMAFPDIGKGDPVYVSARQRFAKLARTEGFGYLDLSDAFSHDQDPNNLFVKVHFSKLGHDLTARQLAAYLKSAGLLPD